MTKQKRTYAMRLTKGVRFPSGGMVRLTKTGWNESNSKGQSMVSELIKDSQFVLAFHGECPFCGIFQGWQALLAEIHEQYTVNDDEHAELIERLEDSDGWSYDDCRGPKLPWFYREDTGEIGHMAIYRVLP